MKSQMKKLTEISNLDPGKPSAFENFLIFMSFLLILICPLLFFFCFKMIGQHQQGVILRYGRMLGKSPVGPGLTFWLPCCDVIIVVDTRCEEINLGFNEILTYDFVTVQVSSLFYYRITKPIYTTLNVRHYRSAMELLGRTVLTNSLGRFSLMSLLSNREILGAQLQREFNQAVPDFGVEVEAFLINDVILPHDLHASMVSEAEGSRLAKARVFDSETEIKAAEILAQASQVFIDTPYAMQLRYLQTLNFIAQNKCTSIVFPYPIKMFDCKNQYKPLEEDGHGQVCGIPVCCPDIPCVPCDDLPPEPCETPRVTETRSRTCCRGTGVTCCCRRCCKSVKIIC